MTQLLIPFYFSERIFGYKNLNIDIYFLSSSVHFYLNVDYEEKINPKKYHQFKVKAMAFLNSVGYL